MFSSGYNVFQWGLPNSSFFEYPEILQKALDTFTIFPLVSTVEVIINLSISFMYLSLSLFSF